ncbi:MAG: GNAT family N-acetyltransferase, partial [Candidatus Marinimicrobia bacterium]|nr:GNAT family N-acetyltransferase [Candidatus Neomarinimicrobiota bacterium]
PLTTRYLPNKASYPIQGLEWAAKRITHWEIHGFGTFILRDKKHIDPIGFCGLEYVKDTLFIDIRYGLVQKVWGKGLAFEAAQTCIQYGFSTLKFDMIYGAAVPENKSSIAVLLKLGMTPDPSFDAYGDVVDSFSIKKPKIQVQHL